MTHALLEVAAGAFIVLAAISITAAVSHEARKTEKEKR